MIDQDLANTFHLCLQVVSSLWDSKLGFALSVSQTTWKKYFHSSNFKKGGDTIETVAPRQGVHLQTLFLRVQHLKGSLIAGMALASVIVLEKFRQSEAKWRQLPSLFSKELEASTAPCLQSTKVERSSCRQHAL